MSLHVVSAEVKTGNAAIARLTKKRAVHVLGAGSVSKRTDGCGPRPSPYERSSVDHATEKRRLEREKESPSRDGSRSDWVLKACTTPVRGGGHAREREGYRENDTATARWRVRLGAMPRAVITTAHSGGNRRPGRTFFWSRKVGGEWACSRGKRYQHAVRNRVRSREMVALLTTE